MTQNVPFHHMFELSSHEKLPQTRQSDLTHVYFLPVPVGQESGRLSGSRGAAFRGQLGRRLIRTSHREGPSLKLTHVGVGRIPHPSGCWTEGHRS